MQVAGGPVTVRHGRRTDGDTANILLHGAAGSWTTWTPLLQAGDDSGSNLNDLIIPDFPGWGNSPLPANESALSVESLAELIAQVARSLGYERWNVIGHSMGGFIALQLAASEVRATTSVGLVSATSLSIQASVRRPIRNFSLLPAFTLLFFTMRVLRLAGPLGRTLVRAVTALGVLRFLVSPLFYRADAIDATVVAALGAEVRPRGFVLAAIRAGGYDSAARWSQIRCPVRSVHGDNDVFVTTGDDDHLRAAVPHCAISVITGTGHFGQVERPFEVLRELGFTVSTPHVTPEVLGRPV